MGEFYDERRVVVPYERIPKKLVQAFIASEDASFFDHSGVSYSGLVRGLWRTYVQKTGIIGGSTISQQTAKAIMASVEGEKSVRVRSGYAGIRRKLREFILTRRLESNFTKEEILHLYLNEVYLGHHSYGVQAAAEHYFRTNVWELTLPEMALIAGLPQAPSSYSPFAHPEKSRARRSYVLRRMAEEALAGYGTPGNDCPGQTLQFWASDLKRSADPAQARSLLKAAGQENLQLTLYTADIIPGMNETATLYAQQAKAGGVNVNVKVVDPAIYYSAASPGGNYLEKTFSINNWTTETSSMALFYLSALYKQAPYNETHFTSPQADALLFDALADTNDASAEQKWHAVQELQFNQGGYIVTNNFNWLDGYSTKVRGIHTTSTGPCDYYNFKTAWLSA